MDSRDDVRMKIERIETELRSWKEHLANLDRLAAIDAARSLPEGPDTKYAGVRPLLAIQAILKEHKKPMAKAELVDLLMKGGIAYGKKRALVNVDMGIVRALEAGSITMSGKDDMIGLPEWSKKK